MQSTPACHRAITTQFSLRHLFEYMTLCCMLAALTGVLGIGPSVCLMLLGLALGAGQGLLSLAFLWAALLLAALPFGAVGHEVVQQTTIVLTAAGMCGWYRWRVQRALSSER